jgi:diguanylate cyclase (GGDEF)-like protein/PAS domain S-box-containing protein
VNTQGADINTGFLAVMVFLAITPLISLFAAGLAWRKRPNPGSLAMTVLALGALVWSLGYNLELYNPVQAGKMFWAQFRYIGIGVIPVAWFVFGLQFSGLGWLVNRKTISLLMVIPTLTLVLVFTNAWHGWIWSFIDLQPGAYLNTLEVRHGFWFWVFTVYSYILLLSGTILALETLGRALARYRWLFGLVLLGSAIPAIFNFFNLLGFSPLYGIDMTLAAFSVSGLLFAVAFWRFNLFDVVSVARNTVFDTLEDGILVLDAAGHILHANRAGQAIAQIPSQGAADLTLYSLTSLATEPARAANPESPLHAELTVGDGDARRWYELRGNPLSDHGQKVVGRLLVWHDITARKQIEEQLRYLSMHDRLTGLYNRQYFDEEMTRLARGRTWPITVLVGDLDNLKVINDGMGHMMGDNLIRRAANVLRLSFRAGDVVARVGGDEFAALLPDASEEAALQVISRIRAQELVENEGYPDAQVAFSLGFAVVELADDLSAMYKLADLRMYEQKIGRKMAK